MSLKGLENAIRNLNSLDRHMVPQASAWAVNRVAASAVSAATHRVAKEAVAGDNQKKGIPFRLVKQRVRLWKASATGKNYARIRVNRGNLPAIKLGSALVRLSRRGGKLLRRGSVLKIGPYLFRDAFIQQLANGRWHVMRRACWHRWSVAERLPGRQWQWYPVPRPECRKTWDNQWMKPSASLNACGMIR